ncbi:MFS transporter [Microbacterium sp. EST19A]|uniref:MFS transporter n=1 Tax=Microbacterium sp. EST19A TaxID=2862681 RepID=UPI001CC0B3D8|nr:MFS transporter [Microbacterium sp. EST19A]
MSSPRSTARGTGRRALPLGLSLAGTAVAFMSLYLGAGALTPLLVDYKDRFTFAPEMLNVAFAVYAAGFLVAVLVFGSLSDFIGRRPVLIGGLIVQLGSNLLFLTAGDVGAVIAGRIVQGIASGAATAAFTAAMVELAPGGDKRLGAILGSISLTGGLALGSVLAGLAIELTPGANTVIFVILIVLTLLGIVVAILSPETGRRRPGALRSLIPRVAVPAAARAEFLAAAPVVAAVWMLAGLSGGLAPNMVRSVFGIDSPFLGGFAGFVAPAVSTVIGIVFAKIASRHAMVIGIYASILGAAAIIGGVFAGSLVLMILGQAIAGVGFGSSFTAALQLLIPLVDPQQRAGIVAAVYIVSYTAFGLPIVIEGQIAGPLGEIPAVVCYTALTILFALISLVAQARIARRG